MQGLPRIAVALLAVALAAGTPVSFAAEASLSIPSLEQLAKDGRIRAGGLHVGARSGALIVEAKSHTEVTELVRAVPAWGVWSWEVSPLESFAFRAGVEKKVLKQLRSMKP